ncbi:MAG: PQQ-binding-like beta-propeller repeat protein [Planctomycetaceae bacterium]|nr:PQQ-binding-like beta-propeller repeat protein [Planctomycetaceae bacterium]
MHRFFAMSLVLFVVVAASKTTLVAQEPRVLSGHNGAVMMADFVADNSRVATASSDQTASLWDVATGKRLQTYTQHTGPLYSLAVSRDGRTLVTGAQDNTLRVWDLPMSAPLLRLAELNSRLNDIALSSDGRSMIATSVDGQVRTIDLSTKPFVIGARTGHTSEVTCAAWKSDGSVFATGDTTGRMMLWSPDLETPLSILHTHQNSIRSLQFVNGNQQLASVSMDGSVRTWQLTVPPGKIVHTADSEVTHCVAVPGQAQLLITTAKGALRILNQATGEVVRELPAAGAAPNAAISRIAVTPNGTTIFCGHADGKITALSAADGMLLGQFAGHASSITDLTALGDNQSLVSSSADGTTRLWKLPAASAALKGHPNLVREVRTAPSRQWTLTTGEDGSCRTWNATGSVMAQTTFHMTSVRSAAIRDDALCATGDADGNVWLWNPSNGTVEGYVKAHSGVAQTISFCADPAVLITAGADGLIRGWTLPLPKARPAEGEAPPKPAWEIMVPDGQSVSQIVTGMMPQTRLGLTASGSAVVRFRATGELEGVTSLAEGPIRQLIASDIGQLATVNASGVLALLNDDLSIRKKLLTQPSASAARWDREGTRLVVCDGSDAVRIVDIETGRVLEILKVPGTTSVAEWNGPEQRSLTTWAATGEGQLVNLSLTKLWDTGTTGATFSVVSPDGQQIWTADSSGRVLQRAIADGKIAKTIEAASAVVEFVRSENGQWLVAATADRHLKSYRNDGTPGSDIVVNADVQSLALNSDGTRLLAGLTDGRILVVETATGQVLENFRDHTPMTAVRGVRFASDNQTVFSCGSDNTVRVQRCSCQKVVAMDSAPGATVMLQANGTQALTSLTDGKSVLKNLTNGNIDREFRMPEPKPITSMTVRPDGQRVAAGTATGDVLVWNFNNGETPLQMLKVSQPVSMLIWSNDGRRLAVVAKETIEIFGPSLPNVQPLVELVPYQAITCSMPVREAVFTVDGRTLYAGLDNGIIEEWTCASPEQRRQFNHGGPVYGVAVSNDGNTVVSCSTDQTVRVWDVIAGQQKFQLNGHLGAVHSVAINPDESLAVSSGADKTLRLWDIVGGRQLKQLTAFEATMYSVAIHPGGQIIAAAGADRKVHLIDLTTGAEIRTLTGHSDFVHSVTFSPDGSQLMSYGYAGQLRIWNTADGALAREVRRGRVGNSARYSPDGKQIVIGNGDGTASVFGVAE